MAVEVLNVGRFTRKTPDQLRDMRARLEAEMATLSTPDDWDAWKSMAVTIGNIDDELSYRTRYGSGVPIFPG